MKKGDKVIYNGEEWEIFFTYESGYCEIKKPSRKNIVLVHQSEVKVGPHYEQHKLSSEQNQPFF